jgi:hypothetical protein
MLGRENDVCYLPVIYRDNNAYVSMSWSTSFSCWRKITALKNNRDWTSQAGQQNGLKGDIDKRGYELRFISWYVSIFRFFLWNKKKKKKRKKEKERMHVRIIVTVKPINFVTVIYYRDGYLSLLSPNKQLRWLNNGWSSLKLIMHAQYRV